MYIWKVIKIGSNIDICFLVFLSFNWKLNRDTFLGEIIFCELGKKWFACLPVDMWKIHHWSIYCLFFYYEIFQSYRKIWTINWIVICTYVPVKSLHFVLFPSGLFVLWNKMFKMYLKQCSFHSLGGSYYPRYGVYHSYSFFYSLAIIYLSTNIAISFCVLEPHKNGILHK